MIHGVHRAPERLSRGHDYARILAAHAKGDGKRTDLHRGPFAGEDCVERAANIVRVERAPGDDGPECVGESGHEGAPLMRRTQFESSALPSSVSTLSGWNCTPSTSSERCTR